MLTAEMVTNGHPDKFCDQVADAILDRALKQDPNSRVAIECLAKDNLLMISGEMATRAQFSVAQVARAVWQDHIGYGPGTELVVINQIQGQSPDIGRGNNGDGGVDFGGAGDQGIMLGYATDETPEMMPFEYICARRICERLQQLRTSRELSWLKPDGKSQVTVRGGAVTNVVIAAHHDSTIAIDELRSELKRRVIEPLFGTVPRVVINGTGAFTVGGPWADAGVVGRKIVVDAYGPRIPVGGGAFSGKDPSKVDRSAAYMARHIAKTIVAHQIGSASECLVSLAFGIGQRQPEMVTAITETGRDLSRWVRAHFRDLSPEAITTYLELRQPKGWTYLSTASFGHFGRDGFPWERVARI